MATMKPYVRIQSSKTINVTCSLDYQDVTNKDAHVPDRLKINPLWPKATVLIKTGAGIYPSEIVEWPTVKALQKDKVLTIGEFVDGLNEEDNAQSVEKAKETLKRGLEEIKRQKAQSLSEIAGG